MIIMWWPFIWLLFLKIFLEMFNHELDPPDAPGSCSEVESRTSRRKYRSVFPCNRVYLHNRPIKQTDCDFQKSKIAPLITLCVTCICSDVECGYLAIFKAPFLQTGRLMVIITWGTRDQNRINHGKLLKCADWWINLAGVIIYNPRGSAIISLGNHRGDSGNTVHVYP